MNTKIQFLISLVFAIFFLPHQANAQSKQEWQPIYLNIVGDNKMNGVEASYQVSTCNGEEMIYIKFVNSNNYPVKIEWFDAVFTQASTWINKEKDSDKKSLTLAAKAEAKGECSKKLYLELCVQQKNFIVDKKDFKRYMTDQLMVNAVQ